MKFLITLFSITVANALAFSKPPFFPHDKRAYRNFLQERKMDSLRTESDEGCFQTFRDNLDFINTHNARNDSLYTLRANSFTDLRQDLLHSRYFQRNFPMTNRMGLSYEHMSLTCFQEPTSKQVNWKNKKRVTPVKNQGPCGSCWAFSAVGALESKIAIRTGKLTRLSEQMTVDCSSSNYGCRGGYMHTAFEDIGKMNGLSGEEDYPYAAQKGLCRLDLKRVPGSEIMGYHFITPYSVEALKRAVQKQPVCIAVAGDSRDFLFYGGGILDNTKLSSRINHAVLLVGYNEDHKVPYWIIKNSWGNEWGEDGYIRIKMADGKGIVGMNQYGVYPF